MLTVMHESTLLQNDLAFDSVYMFDEPSSYLDVKQRLTAARLIRELCEINDSQR